MILLLLIMWIYLLSFTYTHVINPNFVKKRKFCEKKRILTVYANEN